MISPWMRFIATIFVFAPFMVAHAQWNSDPASNNPICRAGNNQVAPKLVSDGKGGAIICWADERSSQNFYEVYAQRISGDGIVQWTQNGIAVAPLNNAQLKPEMISDDAGGAIVVWTDTRNGNIDIYAQRIDSSGNALWTVDGVAVAFGGMDQTDPKLTGDGNHGAIVTWSAHTGSSQDSHIYAQRIDGTGKLAWSQEVQVSSSDQFESSPCIAGDGSGGAYIAWSFYNNGQYDVFAQRLNAGGAPQWQFGGIGIATGNAPEAAPVLATDGTGKAFLAWHDWGFGSASVVQIAVLNPDGSTAASLRASSTSGGQENPRLSNIGPGLLGIAWEDGRVAMNTRAYAQIVDNTGTKSWAADGVAVSSRAGRQVTPFVISDGNGGMIVVWEDRTGGVTESDLYAQRIAADGSLLWSGTGVPLCTAGQMQSTPSMISDGENGAIVTWEDYRSSFSNPDVYAARILADGTFPVGPPILSFSSTTVDFGAVSVGSSATERITLTNTGGVPVTIASITTNDPHFSLTPDSSTMFPNSSVTASVRFQPTSKGALDATIVVESNSIHGPDTVFVTGTGTASAAIELDKASLDFGNVTTGSSKSLVLNISNPGNDTLTISSISTDNPAFTVAVTSRILEPGAAFDDTVHFSPTAPGLVTGELTVTSNAPTSPTIVPLSGTGIPVVTMTIDPEEISFGEVAIGFHRDTTLTVTNTGNDTLHISSFTSGDPRFTLETPIEGIAPAGFRTLTLRFTPDAVGPLSTVFTVTSNAETSPDTILVQGTGREVTAVRAVRVVPGAFTLFGNYPNPFNPSTT
ncbi:MAG: choice-of-anchor D domain-containing protein, partial [Bacteroidetes bacterium]|nr:choice-of-anchor D domain-containing protein [Bacteroidota bacterium]